MERVKIDFFKEVSFISQLKGQGNYLSYVVSNADLDKNDYTSSIYLYDLNEKKHRRLTSGARDQAYLWLNDQEILFRGKRDEAKDKIQESHFYKINIHGGEAEKYLSLPYQVGKVEFINEDELLFTGSYVKALDALRNLEGHEKEDYIKTLKEEDDYEVIEEIPFWSNGSTFTRGKRNALYKHSISKNETVMLSDEGFQVLDFTVEKNFNTIYVSGKDFKGKSEVTNNLYELKDDQFIKISPLADYSYRKWIQVSKDELIIYGTDHKTYGLNENSKFNLFNKADKTYKTLSTDFYHSTGNAIGSDLRIGNKGSDYVLLDDKIVFPMLDDFTSKLMTLDFSGNIKEFIDTKAGLDEYIYHNNRFYGIAMIKDQAQELYDLDDMTALSSYNHKLYEKYDIRPVQHMTYKNKENRDLDGFMIRPSDFDPSKKYPTILDIHGGPKTAYGDILYHEMQYWANQGYVVIYCNPRGSDGKENAFADIRGKYGKIDYDDIMAFVDHILAHYDFVDENNLGVTGGSYGGFMTNWIIGHTNRFKAAASQRSISNWVGFFGTSDIGYYFASDQVDATPWSDHELMWEQSPLKYADQVQTPTLFIHSVEDYRCWIPEAYQMFTALKYHDVPSRLVTFKGENHELSRSGKPKHRIRRLKEITEWFDIYLK